MTIAVTESGEIYIYKDTKEGLTNCKVIINEDTELTDRIYIQGYELCKNTPMSRKTMVLCKTK